MEYTWDLSPLYNGFDDERFASDGIPCADTLCSMMTDAQKTAYGDGLDESTPNPYMWVCQGHYDSGGLSFCALLKA